MSSDPGLQPERTALAWTRTSLSVVVGGLAGMRILPPTMGAASVGLALAVTAAGLALGLAAHRRSERVEQVLLSTQATLPDGRLLASVAFAATGIAAAAIAGVLYAATLR